ncbi:hypothetical protein BCR43DRAFT_441187 [Syncephalastrum racemosum]|uniref:Uncharacterized protein n=1 Tax=Syncephalastrum racemosum TaxID=13706 RepID=A0A1X2HB24_SYNRA|nr:hypothetical protein BCR43DRAFT_441187 [Syncephalastrum racemosum]
MAFASITANPPGPLTIYLGWQGYCIDDKSTTTCYSDDGVMMLPFEVTVAEKFNGTYPELFKDENAPAEDPGPSHNPNIYAASVLCLLCGGGAWAVGALCMVFYRRFTDTHYARGFLAWGAAVLALLLLAESSVMYQSGVESLNTTYPHLIAAEGTGMPMIGVAFATFVIAGYTYLHGCFSEGDEEADLGDTGYTPL